MRSMLPIGHHRIGHHQLAVVCHIWLRRGRHKATDSAPNLPSKPWYFDVRDDSVTTSRSYLIYIWYAWIRSFLWSLSPVALLTCTFHWIHYQVASLRSCPGEDWRALFLELLLQANGVCAWLCKWVIVCVCVCVCVWQLCGSWSSRRKAPAGNARVIEMLKDLSRSFFMSLTETMWSSFFVWHYWNSTTRWALLQSLELTALSPIPEPVLAISTSIISSPIGPVVILD